MVGSGWLIHPWLIVGEAGVALSSPLIVGEAGAALSSPIGSFSSIGSSLAHHWGLAHFGEKKVIQDFT